MNILLVVPLFFFVLLVSAGVSYPVVRVSRLLDASWDDIVAGRSLVAGWWLLWRLRYWSMAGFAISSLTISLIEGIRRL